MIVSLIQEKQNALYQFETENVFFYKAQVVEYQKDMIQQNLLLMEEAARQGTDLIVSSEAINYPGQPDKVEGDYLDYIPTLDDELFVRLGMIAKMGNCYLAAGVYRKEWKENSWQAFNSVVFYDRSGKICEIYDKTHLVGDENLYLTKGNQYKVVETDFGKIGFAICWDMQFPETAWTLTDMGADMVIVPTWGWEWIYGPCRAYENGIYVAAAMAVPYYMPIEGLRSPSEVISPEGTIIMRGSLQEAGIISCEISDIRNHMEKRDLRKSCRRQHLSELC